jgi:uncharacterized membrane protein YjgN (DUF898 family)
MHIPDDATLLDPLDTPDTPAAPDVRTARFTGSGSEYFRIWTVNLLLSLATLGIYSAWAKVRRLQYFDRNTQLAGACFDFRGNPVSVLRGRILAVVLLAAYHYAFGFSIAFGIGVIVFILLALPYLLRAALRFRLANTQYRGLWLGFNGSVRAAYLVFLPPVAAFLLPGAMVAVFPDEPGLIGASLVPYLAWPLMHGRAKAYQQRHILVGNHQSTYELPARRFYKPYLASVALSMLAICAGIACAAAIVFALRGVEGAPEAASFTPLLLTAIYIYILYLMAGPFMQVRINNLAWTNTSFPGVRVRSTMSARAFVRLQAGNALLTVVTLGLYRPFAVVKVHRYRLAHTEFEFEAGFEQAAAQLAQGRRNAAGDGVADTLGIDLSW